MSMFYAVRCPSCLLTIYTVLSAERKKGLSVVSLSDENLAFYNCPFPLCDYRVDTNHDVNLYSNISTQQRIYVSPGFTLAPRTYQTKAFRSKLEVDALAIKLDIAKDLPIKPPVPEAQIGDKVQAPKDPGEKYGQGDAPVPAVAQDTPQKNKTIRGLRWTATEVEKAKRMANEGRSHDEIAKEMERSVSAVKNKIAAMRDKGELPALDTPLKKKRDLAGVGDRPTYAT